jgi:hypothetical protein
MLRNLKCTTLFLAFIGSVPIYYQAKKEQGKLEKQAKKEQARKGKNKRGKKRKKKELPENIEAFPKNFLIRPRFVYPEVSLNVSNRMFGKGEKFKYKPSIADVVGLSLKIKKVYISAAIQLQANDRLKKIMAKQKTGISILISKGALFYGVYFIEIIKAFI